jgi:hypothetical protein
MEDNAYDEAFDAAPEEEPDETEEDLELYGLIYRGYLTKDVPIGRHNIKVKTLKIGEELEASLLAAKYGQTAEASRALATALASASVVSVDDRPLIEKPLGPQEDNTLEARWQYILDNWYWITVRDVYRGYNALLKEVLDKYESVKKD